MEPLRPLSRDELLRKLKRLKRFLPRGFRAQGLSDDELNAALCDALRWCLAHKIADDDPFPHWPVWLWRLVRWHNAWMEDFLIRYIVDYPYRRLALPLLAIACFVAALIRMLGG